MLWQGYQFWTRADENGYFCINNIRAGDYNLYAWVPGFIGDYRYDYLVTIISGIIFQYPEQLKERLNIKMLEYFSLTDM